MDKLEVEYNVFKAKLRGILIHTIYVKLLDEGVDVWRPVQARQDSSDTYFILVPLINHTNDSEDWEFPPGSYVKVQEKESDGQNILVAYALSNDSFLFGMRRINLVLNFFGLIVLTNIIFAIPGAIILHGNYFWIHLLTLPVSVFVFVKLAKNGGIFDKKLTILSLFLLISSSICWALMTRSIKSLDRIIIKEEINE